MDDDKRHDRRQRVLKGGRILFNGHNSSVDCAVRDFSEHGARLRLDSLTIIPETFDLLVQQNGQIYPSKLAWQRVDELGVEFTGAPRPTARQRA